MSNHMFSVVTVCFNAENDIEGTMKSVLHQRCTDYEYIVIDGKSTDRTLEKVTAMEHAFLEKGVGFTCVSEKDNGIYNAMNKAIDAAHGEYIVFMNAGDHFYSEHTLEEVKTFLNNNAECDIVVGDIIIKYRGLYQYKSIMYHGLNSPLDICHQSTYTRTLLLKERKYDESYTLAADRDFFCHAVSRGSRVSVLHRPLSIYQEGGASATDKGRDEIQEINAKYSIPVFPEKQNASQQSSDSTLKRIKSKLHGYIPQAFLDRRRKKQMLNAGWSLVIPGEDE